MKRSEIEFDKIEIAYQLLIAIRNVEDFETLRFLYLRIDEHLRNCLRKHRTAHRTLRQMDFVELRFDDFMNANYIYGRINKQMKCFELLKSLEKKKKI